MRYRLKDILLAMLAFYSFTILSQESIKIEIVSQEDDYQIIQSDNGLYHIKPNNEDDHFFLNNDMPAIPFKVISVLVPNGSELTDYDFVILEKQIKDSIAFENSPYLVPTTLSFNNILKESAPIDIYPKKPIYYTSISEQRGFTQINFRFSPFKFKGKEQALYFIEKLELTVSYKINEQEKTFILYDKFLANEIAQNAINPQDMKRFYGSYENITNKSAKEQIDYLIITNNELKESFSPLLEWKERKGLNTKIITVENIYQNYEGPTQQLKIKQCLYEYYKLFGLKWALLGGDRDIVPVQYCYDMLRIDTNIVNSIPTDMFYSCFGRTFNWDGYEDGMFGHVFFDGIDVVPDIYLTRIPVNTVKDAKSVVNKTLIYEKNPFMNANQGKSIFAGVKLWNEWDNKSDSHHRSEFVYKKFIKNKAIGDNIYLLDTYNAPDASSTKDLTTANLADYLNSGFNIFHFSGHGIGQSLDMEVGSHFSPNDAYMLNNSVGGIMLTNSCNTNAFDKFEPSFSEAILRNPNGGCVAFWGSSRYGFGNPNMNLELGTSLKYNAKLFDYIFNDKLPSTMTFGEITTLTKTSFSKYGPSNNYVAHLLYAINPLGDPELPLFRGVPNEFKNVRIYEMGDVLHINTGGVDNCKICITSLDLKDGFKATAHNVYQHSFSNLPKHYQITITAPNYKPFIYIAGNFITNTSSFYQSNINIFPNPVHDILSIDFSFPNGVLEILDIQGRLLQKHMLTTGSNKINVNNLPKGVLILNLRVDNNSLKYKVLKQ